MGLIKQVSLTRIISSSLKEDKNLEYILTFFVPSNVYYSSFICRTFLTFDPFSQFYIRLLLLLQHNFILLFFVSIYIYTVNIIDEKFTITSCFLYFLSIESMTTFNSIWLFIKREKYFISLLFLCDDQI